MFVQRISKDQRVGGIQENGEAKVLREWFEDEAGRYYSLPEQIFFA